MKVSLVNGSPHETGNTYQTLQIISECLDENGIESRIFQLGNDKVREPGMDFHEKIVINRSGIW